MIAIDTNLLLYAYDTRDPLRQAESQKLIVQTQDAVLLWQVACEFVAASRKLRPAVMTLDQAWECLGELRGLMPLVLPTEAIHRRARGLLAVTQVQYWDAMIYAACLEAGIQTLLSEDVPGTTIEGLVILNPLAPHA